DVLRRHGRRRCIRFGRSPPHAPGEQRGAARARDQHARGQYCVPETDWPVAPHVGVSSQPSRQPSRNSAASFESVPPVAIIPLATMHVAWHHITLPCASTVRGCGSESTHSPTAGTAIFHTPGIFIVMHLDWRDETDLRD